MKPSVRPSAAIVRWAVGSSSRASARRWKATSSATLAIEEIGTRASGSWPT
ncbi:MAG TPA: hypothetical protein VFG42_22470 [Baekduia sp.]|nr:hypothetical protein [Baekduia sp.]HET6509579.1 hypothetical protein [Baekduia sp.]